MGPRNRSEVVTQCRPRGRPVSPIRDCRVSWGARGDPPTKVRTDVRLGGGTPVRVFGVDPGLTRCGFGVVDGGPGRAVKIVAGDVVRTSVDDDLAIRLLTLADAVEVWLDRYRPEVVAIE